MEEKDKKQGCTKNRNKSSGKSMRIFLIVVCVLEALILAFLLFGTILLDDMFSKFGHDLYQGGMSEDEYMQNESNNPNINGEEIDPDDIDWGDPAYQIGGGKDVINLLLIGQDRREGEGRARSDSMILCTINKKNKTVTMTSFMRDMYVQIPGYMDNRINASYAFGGMELLNECLYVNFGIVVDGNIEVDFSGFQEVIELVGGIDIELSAAEARYLNKWGNWDVEDNAGEWSLVEGMNHLNGSQALAYSRIREVGNGDYGRTNRQRVVLTELIEESKSMNLSQVRKLLNKILPLLTTDLTNQEIFGLAMELFPQISDYTINTQQIPADGAHYGAFIREMAVLVPDLEKNREILAGIMAE